MTVQELFQTLDIEDIVDAYLFGYGYDSSSIEKNLRPVDSKLKEIVKWMQEKRSI